MTSLPAASKKGSPINFRPGYDAVREQHLELRLNDTLTERYALAVTSKDDPFDTACWSYDRSSKTHIITFGEKITEHLKPGCEASLPDYAKSYYRHEVAHSLWTVRDLDALNSKLTAAGANFPLFNLLEDARIESRWRKEFGGSFNWLNFEEPLIPPERIASGRPVAGQPISPQWAIDVLTTIIQNEGNHQIREPGGVLADDSEADSVWDFYGKLCSVPDQDDRAMLDLVKNWVTQFGVPPNVPNGSSRAGGSDIKTAAEIQHDPTLSGALSALGRGEESPGKGVKGYQTSDKKRSGVLLPNPSHLTSQKRSDVLEKIIGEAFRFGELRTKREAPTRRLSVRDVILQRPKCFIHKQKEREMTARVFLLVDASGSMGGPPADSGRHIALALAGLARRGKIEGHIAISQCRSAIALHEVIPLRSFTEDIARRVPADGDAEGIAATIRACAHQIQEADLFVCYTDGNITDAPITDAERSIWHRRGIYTIGAYVGDAERADRLKEHFDSALCRSTEKSLAIALATLVRRYSVTKQRVRGNSKTEAARTASVDTDQVESEDSSMRISL